MRQQYPRPLHRHRQIIYLFFLKSGYFFSTELLNLLFRFRFGVATIIWRTYVDEPYIPNTVKSSSNQVQISFVCTSVVRTTLPYAQLISGIKIWQYPCNVRLTELVNCLGKNRQKNDVWVERKFVRQKKEKEKRSCFVSVLVLYHVFYT